MASGEHFRASIFLSTADGSIFVNNYGYLDNSGGGAHIDTATGATAFQSLVETTFQAALPGDCHIFQYRFATVFSTSHLGEIGYVTINPIAGTAGFLANYPNEICISMKRSTGHAARTERGRIFFGPVSSDWADTGGNVNRCVSGNATLQAVADLSKSNLTVGGVVLKPILVDANGDSTENVIIHTPYALEFVHRRSRRPTIGT